MLTFKEFIEKIQREEIVSLNEAVKNRNQELSNTKDSNFFTRYAIQIIVQNDTKELLLEHEQYKQFKKSTDLYFKHPENPDIPVQAHYHIVNSRSKQDIYAVNVDGTAHHRANTGFVVPKKQADELRKLGVNIAPTNILESKQLFLNESFDGNMFSFFIIFED